MLAARGVEVAPRSVSRLSRTASYRHSPSAVSVTPRGLRSNSGTPSSASSWNTCWLTAGWVEPSRAAAVKLASRAADLNARSACIDGNGSDFDISL